MTIAEIVSQQEDSNSFLLCVECEGQTIRRWRFSTDDIEGLQMLLRFTVIPAGIAVVVKIGSEGDSASS